MVTASNPQSVKILAISGGWRPCGEVSLATPREEYWRSQLGNRRPTARRVGRTNSV